VCVCSRSYPACNASALCYVVVWPLQLYSILFTLPNKQNDFRKIKLLIIKRVLWFFPRLLSETFLITWSELDVIPNVKCFMLNMFYSVRFKWNLNFLDICFSKNTQISNFMKIRPMEASCSMRSDGRQIGLTKLKFAFRTIANTLKNREVWMYLTNLLITENFPYIHA